MKLELSFLHNLQQLLIVLTLPWQIILSNKESEEKAFKLRREIQKLENENQTLR